MSRPADRISPMPQRDAYSSPWSVAERVRYALWQTVWLFLFRPTPKFLFSWRLFLLRLFGTRVRGRPFVAASARIRFPWKLALDDRACIGEYVDVYNLGPVILGPRSTVAYQSHLCSGTHDFSTGRLPLMIGPIRIGADAFIGSRVIVLPGVIIGDGAVIGSGAVVSQDIPAWQIAAGNPCRVIKERQFTREEEAP